jgi:hypothetical protein
MKVPAATIGRTRGVAVTRANYIDILRHPKYASVRWISPALIVSYTTGRDMDGKDDSNKHQLQRPRSSVTCLEQCGEMIE